MHNVKTSPIVLGLLDAGRNIVLIFKLIYDVVSQTTLNVLPPTNKRLQNLSIQIIIQTGTSIMAQQRF